MIAGNTVVLKPAAEGSLTAWHMAKCMEDAGVPAGVFNMVYGGDEPGKALVANPALGGLTFTGSYDVGMSIIQSFTTAAGYYRPVIAEMGGKNPTIVTDKADLDKAALGVMRSAFGLTGQKCSACSRVYVDADVHDEFVNKLVDLADEVAVGDPTDADTYMGPIISQQAYEAYQQYVDELGAGQILAGGRTLPLGKGYFVAPTVVADLPDEHRLWQHEMFAPIVAVRSVSDKDEAMRLANDVALGLTGGHVQRRRWRSAVVPGQYRSRACSMSIARPGQPRALGPAISHSAAGKAARAAARQRAACIICSNTCASSRIRLSNDCHRGAEKDVTAEYAEGGQSITTKSCQPSVSFSPPPGRATTTSSTRAE